ncbi:MAG: glycosyltransferase family 2 protein [Acetatifactor sp.]|nr:glycosyltransferase family 2 protein [Acetatifactor sp.]
MHEITVVIPNYNGKGYLDDCLTALSKQDFAPGFETLVVDNGSTDGSVELLREKWGDVQTVLLPENTGFCHAVNVGIEKSDSPFVILLNNDTKVKAGFIKELYNSITQDEKIFSVSAQMLMWDEPEYIDDAGDRYCVMGWAFSRGKGKRREDYNKPCEVFAACGGAAIYRKSIFDEIGLFDELHFAYLEDIDIGYRAKIFGYRNLYEPGAQVIHYGSASSGSRYNAWKTEIAAANNIYLVGKNMPFLQLLINLPFLFVGFFLKFLFFCKKRMGKIYLKGIAAGFRKLFSKDGRKRIVRFLPANFGHYFGIQMQLYANAIRIIKKS